MRPSLRIAAAVTVALLSASAAPAQFIPAHRHRPAVVFQVRSGPFSSFTYAATGYGFWPYLGPPPGWYYSPIPYSPPPVVIQNVIQVPSGNGGAQERPVFPPEFDQPPPKNAPKAPPAKVVPPPKPVERVAPPDPPKPAPRVAGRADADRLTEAGRKAFAEAQYGRALELFRKAADINANEPSIHYLISQAQFALGKYREAVASVAAGMNLRGDWSEARFNSRDLYWQKPEAFDDHLKALRQAVAAYPDDPGLTFLLGHQLWFDGKKDEARRLILKARELGKGQPPAAGFQVEGR
jgi:Anaphase-promoting complex, cyclosome, subunit 3